jgi:hypothetical protein
MSVKRVVDFASYIVDGDMSANITGDSTNILYTDRVAYQLSWTGTPTGTFTVEGSNDELVWVNLPLDPAVTAAGSADDAVIEVETALKFIRLLYTRSSGSGTLQVHITAKSISG